MESKCVVFKKKKENNQYASNIESESTRIWKMHWDELFFGVKVIAISCQLPGIVEEYNLLWDKP